jgi:hypothetical protein
MKKRLILTFWLVGSIGAVVWTCFWIFGVVYTLKFPIAVFLLIALGIFGAFEGFKTFRAERNSR